MTTSVGIDGERGQVRRISRGATSDVFEVTRDGRSVAMKVLHRRADPRDSRRFVREVEALASVRHPNVVRIERVLCDGYGPRALVMPLLAGSTLRDFIAAQGCLCPAAVID